MVQVIYENAQIAIAGNITKQVCVLNVHLIRKHLVRTSPDLAVHVFSVVILNFDIPWWLSHSNIWHMVELNFTAYMEGTLTFKRDFCFVIQITHKFLFLYCCGVIHNCFSSEGLPVPEKFNENSFLSCWEQPTSEGRMPKT